MPDDIPLPDPRDERFYQDYLLTCRQLGVEAVSREKARELIHEWAAAIAAAREIQSTLPNFDRSGDAIDGADVRHH